MATFRSFPDNNPLPPGSTGAPHLEAPHDFDVAASIADALRSHREWEADRRDFANYDQSVTANFEEEARQFSAIARRTAKILHDRGEPIEKTIVCRVDIPRRRVLGAKRIRTTSGTRVAAQFEGWVATESVQGSEMVVKKKSASPQNAGHDANH